jgi:hypothetical protein
MKLLAISFNDDENPKEILVRLTIEEAGYLGRLTGTQSDNSAEAIMQGGTLLNSEVYHCLSGNVFNRYWEDGLNDYFKNRG